MNINEQVSNVIPRYGSECKTCRSKALRIWRRSSMNRTMNIDEEGINGVGNLQSIELMSFVSVVDTLNVAAGQSKLSSQSVWGALRGLETFSQLVYQDDDGMVGFMAHSHCTGLERDRDRHNRKQCFHVPVPLPV